MRRVVIPELLDGDSGTPEEIAASVADLRLINRLFGGISTTRDMFSRVVSQSGKSSSNGTARQISLLDIASASGDVTLASCRFLSRYGVRVTRTLLDRSSDHLPTNGNQAAPALHGSARWESDQVEIPRGQHRSISFCSAACIVGDALRLPFGDASFDMVTCSLFVHHLEPEQIVRHVSEALRVCRTAVLINDLRRSAVSLVLTYLGLPLFRSRITRHDAIASVRRAYTIPELKAILRNLPVRHIEARPHYLFRMGIIVWKR